MPRRLVIVRWLLSTLLGSFAISIALAPPSWATLPRIDVASLGLQGLYVLVVAAMAVPQLIAYLLITPPTLRRKAAGSKPRGGSQDAHFPGPGR